MSKDCTYTFKGPGGADVTLRGQAAIKAFLANGGLQFLREPEVRQSRARDDLFADEFATKRSTVQTNLVVDSRGTRMRGGNVNGAGRMITASKQALQNFWSWFEGSAATDDRGRPLELYHSTNGDFDAFETNRETTNNYGLLGDMAVRRAGIFLTPDKQFSQEYLRSGAGQNVMPVYAAIKDPLDLRRGLTLPDEDRLEKAGISTRYVRNISNYWELFDSADDGSNEFVDGLKAAGYDGAIFTEDSPSGESDGGTTYVAFAANQVKSALGNRGTFDSSDSIVRSAERWYSQLARAIEGVPERLDNQSAAQWSQWLKANASKLGVKQDEVTWSGIEDWLKLKGKAKVSKAEIGEYLAGNGVQVEEVVLGGGGLTSDEVVELNELDDLLRRELDGEDGVLDDADRARMDELTRRKEPGDTPKYGQYTLPGGQNYRELLLTLPKADPLTQGERDEMDFLIGKARLPLSAKNARRLDELRAKSSAGQFKSSHWDQPNILAHIRVNDRTDADGARVLFVEELQSDWAQEGRKKGFASDSDIKPVSRKEYDAFVDKMLDDYIEQRVRAGESRDEAGRRGINMLLPQMAQEIGRADEYQRMRAGRDLELDGGSSKVPGAPFVADTKSWLSLALKRVIKLAVDEGYDKVAFVSGEQSAERYDLSKQVDTITSYRLPDGQFKLSMKRQGALTPEPAITLAEAELEGAVGKDLAEKIISSKLGVSLWTGLDLKVGGEGMKAFYDQIVPQAAGGLVKKMGGKGLGAVELPKPGKRDTGGVSGADVMDYLGIPEAEHAAYWRNLSQEKRNELIEQYRTRAPSDGLMQQPGFEVTDAMREKAAGGMPLFSRDRALQSWAEGVMAGQKRQQVAPVAERLPHPSLKMAGLPERPVTINAMFVRHLANSDHKEITPEVISKLKAMLAAPRAVIHNTSKTGVEQWQILASERDDLGRPILVALRPQTEREGRDTLDVVDVRTMFGRADSMAYITRQLLDGNVVFMPEKDIARVREALDAETPLTGNASPSRPTSRAKVVSLASDEAARQFAAGKQDWRKAKVQISIPEDAPGKLGSIAFSRERSVSEDGTEDPGIRWSPRRGDPPQKTVQAYKLFRVDEKKPGQLFPLFVDANTPVPIGEWLDADIGPAAPGGKVKSKLGPLAFRPGWHAGDLPIATHIGAKSSPSVTKPDLRPDNHVWAEVQLAADRDWQAEANKRGTNAAGKIVPVKAHITDQVPVDGYYRYKTNPNMTGNWLISGSMKVSRILPDKEVAKINAAAGTADLPREQPLDLKKYGFSAKDTKVRASTERQTDTPEFKAWSGGAGLIPIGKDITPATFKSGQPVVVEALHGTTHDFSAFDRSRSNVESDWGAGFYASNNPVDVRANYANESGPDITQRIELAAERSVSNDEFEDMDEARQFHAQRLSGGAPNTMKLFVRFRNPAVIGGRGETMLTIEEPYDEETDEYGEPTGSLVDVVEAIDDAAMDFGAGRRDVEKARGAIFEAAQDGEVSIETVKKIVSEQLVDTSAEDGDSASSEILRVALQAAGFDGIIDTTVYRKFGEMTGMRPGTVHYIAFEPTQLKSAIGNDGSFDDNDPSILSSAARAWDAPGASKFDDVVYKLQDKQIDLKRVVDAVRDARGELRNDLDTYLQEELFHGRAAKRTEDFVNKELQPLVDEMAKRGLTIEDLDQYLHARHAPEANRLIAERNPDNEGLQDGGSGMKTQDALDYMAGLGVDKREHLAAAAAKVDAILAKTRKLVADYELESRDTVNGWGSMFEHYVPLMREDDGDAPARLGTGQGFSIKGREVKSRTGSTRKVVDILANIAMQRERTIVRGEKNRVAQSLVGLAKANPNEDFWTVDLTPMTPTYDPKKGVVVMRPDPMFKARPNVVVAKVREEDGSVKEHAVLFSEKDARAMRTATALKNLDAAQLEGLMGASAGITRYFAAVNTQYNPVFGIVNLVRDVQGALINLQATELAGKQREVSKNTLSALRGIFADARAVRGGKTATSAWASLWEDFQDVGGQTGFRQLFSTSNDRADAIRKALNPDAWMDSKLGKIFTANGTLRVPLAVAMKGARWIFDWLSDYNLAMENGIRLATYKAGLDAGMSRERAASLAKNLTVNFNRKGQIGQQAGAVYAFFNASMQGTARLGQVLFDMEPGKPKTIRLSGLGKKIVYGGLTLGAMQALALAAAGFDDNDPPDFVRERALIIPTSGKTYVSIPMPLGFHLIPSVGRMTTEWALGGFKDTSQRVVKMLGMFADTFNPIGNAGISMQTLAPTALDPLVALTENRDWQGRPIAKESMNKAVPGHALARDTATAWARLLSETVNAATGGNQYVAGAISPTPDQIDYLIGQITGGVGREASKVEQTVKAAVTGEELPLYKIPLVGRFAGNSASQASEGNAFYANTESLNRLETEIKGLQKDGKMAEAAALRASRPDAYLMAQANAAERQIAKLRKEKSELVKEGAPREKVRAIEEQITARMAALNRAAEALKARAPT